MAIKKSSGYSIKEWSHNVCNATLVARTANEPGRLLASGKYVKVGRVLVLKGHESIHRKVSKS